MQMRTKKIKLHKFLINKKVSRHNDSRCQCDRKLQTIKYILLTCRKFNSQRKKLWDKKKRKTKLKIFQMKKIFIDFVNVKKAIIFMKEIEFVDRRTLNEKKY